MDCQFIIDRSARHGCTVLTCAGDLDLVSRDALVAAVKQVVTGGPAGVVVDFSSTTFLDCGSMRLIELLRALLPAATRWTVVCPPGQIRDVLALGGFSSLKGPWVPTLRAALDSGSPRGRTPLTRQQP